MAIQPSTIERVSEENIYRTMIETVQDYAILRLDPDGRVVTWNLGAERFKGYKAAEIIGKSFEVFYTPEDLALGKPQQLLKTALEQGHAEDEGYRVRKDGSRFWADVVVTTLYDTDGTLLGFSKVTRDLTERRRQQQELSLYRTMVDSVQDYAILRLDPEGHVVSWNLGAERFKGYKAAEIIGKSFEVFYTPEDLAIGKPSQLLKTAMEQGHAEAEGYRVRKDGTQFWADVVITALYDSDGTLLGFSKVTRDLTERRRQEEIQRQLAIVENLRQRAIELEEARNQAEAARIQAEKSDQVKSAFLASMSHELRTPLNAIINFTQFVVMGDVGELNEQQAELLTDVVGSSKHLLALINDVLDMAKIESGALVLFIEDGLDLRAIWESAIATCRSLIKPNVKLEVDIAADLPRIRADRLRVLQIMLNILSNACKFTDRGSIRISVIRDQDQLISTVADSGPGISDEDQTKVFTAFVQTESGIRQGSGSGLGMPIAKNLTEAHGGHIWIESVVGQGAAFSVALPILSSTLVPTV